MNEFIDRCREGFARLTWPQKVRLVLAALTTVGLVCGLSFYATHTRYGFLAGGLGQKDAAALIAALGHKRIPYRLSDGGTTIEIPADRVDSVRLELAGENLMPGSGGGFDFVGNANDRHALERELQRTIQRLTAVEGRMLTDGNDGNDGDDSMSATQLEAKHSLERNIESTLVAILEPIVGPGRARARATVELNMTRVQRTEETFDPNVAVVRNEQKSKSGQSGVAAATTNFELNKTTSLIAEPVGTLRRQSVAVVVDHRLVETTGADGELRFVPTQRAPEEMRKITDLVRAAIGIDAERGDVLIVENVPFDERTLPDGETVDGFDWTLWINVARYASLPLTVLLLALLVIRPGIAALRVARADEDGTADPRQTIAHLRAQLHAEMASGAMTDVLQGRTSPLRRKLIEAVGEDPRSAALVVKDWLEDQRKRE